MNLNVDKINAVAPYSVTATKDPNWVMFKTDYGVLYAAGFDRDDTSMPETETYQFTILNGNHKKSPRDSKVRETIVAIIEDFFVENNEVMLYICETGDSKQSMRSRLFEYWFNHYKKGWNVMYLYATVKDDAGVLNYAAIIIRQDHPRLKEIIREFTDAVTVLNDKPQQTSE